MISEFIHCPDAKVEKMVSNASDNHTAARILKTENIFHFNVSQTLAQVIPHFTSSHDAVFVFSDQDKFVGAVSPAYLLARRALTQQTKLKSCIKMPPKLLPDTSLAEVAHYMLDSGLYYLPVVDNERFLGIVTINRLLTYVTRNRIITGNRVIFSKDPLVMITPDTWISQTLTIMKDKRVGKLPVIDGQGKLVGILSQFDLKPLIRDLTPWERSSRSGEKEKQLDIPAKTYMKKIVITMSRVPTFSQTLSLMLAHDVGSVIIVDQDNKPLDIITKRDLLRTVYISFSS